MNTTPMTIAEQLAEPFPATTLGWKPQAVKNNRALAVAYIDARDVMDRLDAVVGPENWQDEFIPLPDGQIVCRLSLRINGEWIAKSDVGGESEQPDADDRKKASFSDALKRAAVKWGVGRYLYSMPSVWCDYDPAKKAFTQTPQLTAKFLPRGATGSASTVKATPPVKLVPAQAPGTNPGPKALPAAATPPAAKAPTPVIPPGLVALRAELADEMKRVGKTDAQSWAECMVWISSNSKGTVKLTSQTPFVEIPPEWIKKLIASLKSMPAVGPKSATTMNTRGAA